jgi:hypothetical protein
MIAERTKQAGNKLAFQSRNLVPYFRWKYRGL